jgi:hypothetical protein
MKKYFILFTLVIFSKISFSQESVPPSLNSFFIDYYDYLFNLTEKQQMESRMLTGEGFFLDTENLNRWPEHFGQKHKLYKSKIDPFLYKQQLDSLKTEYKSTHIYAGHSFDNFQLVGTKNKKLYTEYKLLVDDVYSFNNISNFLEIKQVRNKNFYNIINYFDPNSEVYEWRINNISDAIAAGKFHPYKITLAGSGFFPYLTDGTSYNASRTLSYGISVKPYWILGGHKHWKLLFGTGLGFSSSNIDLSAGNIEKKYENLTDIDNYPFKLIYNGKNIKQNFKFNSIDIPAHISYDRFFESGKINVGIYGGINFHKLFGEELLQTDGEYEYMGEYVLDFYNDPIILSRLPRYGFDKYSYNQITLEKFETNPFYLSAELGVESGYALSDKLSLFYSVSFSKAITPLYDVSGKSSYMDIVAGGNGNTFTPVANPLFAENNQTFHDKFSIKAGISYALFKPVVPHTRKGWSTREINKYVLDKSVIGYGTSEKLEKYILNCNVNLISDRAGFFNQSVNYTFIGPSPKSFKKGRIRSGNQKENTIEFMIPASKNDSRLYIEEPYGYELTFPTGLDVKTIGIYNDIKEIGAKELWVNNSNVANLNIELKKLENININIFWYDTNLDFDLSARENIQSREFDKIDEETIGVIIDNNAPAVSADLNDLITNKLPLASSPSFNTFLLTNYLDDNSVSLRREVVFTLIFPKSECLNMKEYISQLMKEYKLHPDFVKFRIEFYNLGLTSSLFNECKSDLDKMENVTISEF